MTQLRKDTRTIPRVDLAKLRINPDQVNNMAYGESMGEAAIAKSRRCRLTAKNNRMILKNQKPARFPQVV